MSSAALRICRARSATESDEMYDDDEEDGAVGTRCVILFLNEVTSIHRQNQTRRVSICVQALEKEEE